MNINNNIGFSKNPFSKKSSEQETEFIDNIFYHPNYYDTLFNDLKNGDSRFIIGKRGHGKSSIINKLHKDLEQENVLAILINSYDSIPLKKNDTDFLKLIIKKVITKIGVYLDTNKHLAKNLDNTDKEKLSLFFRLFIRTLSKTEYQNIYNSVHKIKISNFLRRLFNNVFLTPVNTLTSGAVNVTSDMIRDSIGLPKIETKKVFKAYFGEISEIEFDTIDPDKIIISYDDLKTTLDDILGIVRKIKFNGTVILFDQIDEYKALNQDIKKIADFTSDLLTDTQLLLNDKLAIGFSLWSELRSELMKTVRFDKFETIDVRWRTKDLKPLIDKRLKHFSTSDNITLDSLILNDLDKQELLKLSHNSPRDLISSLGCIYNEQSNVDTNESIFSSEAISKGLISFSANYDYDSAHPSKSGKNKDIRSMINYLLQQRLTRFNFKNLKDKFSLTNSQTDGRIKLMLQYKLIKQDEVTGADDIKYYDVIEPKVEFLIRRGETSIEIN